MAAVTSSGIKPPLSNSCAKNLLIPQFSMTSESYTTFVPIPKDVLKEKYLKNRLSMRAIAHEFSCSKAYVRSLFTRYKITMRGKQSGADGLSTASDGKADIIKLTT